MLDLYELEIWRLFILNSMNKKIKSMLLQYRVAAALGANYQTVNHTQETK